jgi:uncharacterized protein YecE (DUF72 family)
VTRAPAKSKSAAGPIRVGVGGWTYEPWRGGMFYPEGLKHADELSYASRHLTAIEINGTFYRTQSAASFRKWRDETPDDFVFSVKGHRAVVNKSKLAESGEGIDWFLKSGVLELGDKLGPILWQFAPFKRFNAEDFGAFLSLLPREREGRALTHVVEVRHKSFVVPEFVALLGKHGISVVYADSDDYPAIGDVTGEVVYARLQRSVESEATGYSKKDLDLWAERARVWASGGVPEGIPVLGEPPAKTPRPVFLFMISGHKPHDPAAAMALIERVGKPE